MNTTLSNALPLISPQKSNMSMLQCEAEIKTLRAQHHAAIFDFWKSLKNPDTKPLSSWTKIQFDLFNLMSVRTGRDFDPVFSETPDPDYSRTIWESIRSQVESEDLRGQMDPGLLNDFNLVAIKTSEGGLTLVHAYTCARISKVNESALDVEISEGDSWFYSLGSYETDYDFSYAVPSLYLVGTIGEETREWIPKSLSSSELSEVKQLTKEMESLVANEGASSWLFIREFLPSFPSGVETRIAELEALSLLIYEEGSQTSPELQFIREESSPLNLEVHDLNAQISELKSALQNKIMEMDRLNVVSFLKFHDFELGQSITQSSTGVAGVLALTQGRFPKICLKNEGDRLHENVNDMHLRMGIRRGEWVLSTESEISRPRQN